MGCLPTLVQCNDVRLHKGQRSSTPSTYAKEIKKWNRQHASSQSEHAESMSSIGDEDSGTSSALEAFIRGFYAKTNSLPTLEQCNDIRIQNGQRIIAASSFSKAISKWNREHSNAKTVGALLHDLHAKMGCLPTLAQCNDVRLQNGQRTSTPSTYAKEIKKWNRQHASSQSEHAESSPKGWAT